LFAVLKIFSLGPIGWVGRRIGKQKALVLGLALGGIFMTFIWFLYTPEYPMLIFVLQVLLIWGFPALEVFPMAIMADICDQDELKTGHRREGLFNSSMMFAHKLGLAFSVMIFGIVMNRVGFQEGVQVQEAQTLLNLRLATVIVPAAFVLVAVIILLFLHLPESHVRETRVVLNERKRMNR